MGLALQHVLWSLFWNKKRSLILQDPSFDRKKRKKKKKNISMIVFKMPKYQGE